MKLEAPLPDTFLLEASGLTLLYPVGQLSTLSDRAGDIRIGWNVLKDVLDFSEDSIPSRIGVTEMTVLSGESAEKIRAAAAEGSLTGIPAGIGDSMQALTDRWHMLTDPDGSEEGRLFSLEGIRVAIADERGEIAGCRDGFPQLDVGPNTDVLTGMDKAKALQLLIRAMAPQMVATDEIGGPEDAAAILEASRCGVRVIAAAHGKNVQDARHRQGMEALFQQGVFQKTVVLTGPGESLKIEETEP